mmetsp:Transcript_99170/g.285227  ORF Transcript_99170/g.285227 Transcript_99170/m.285227 type:complete len:205 (+) Transcript_99170:56-670(+)
MYKVRKTCAARPATVSFRRPNTPYPTRGGPSPRIPCRRPPPHPLGSPEARQVQKAHGSPARLPRIVATAQPGRNHPCHRGRTRGPCAGRCRWPGACRPRAQSPTSNSPNRTAQRSRRTHPRPRRGWASRPPSATRHPRRATPRCNAGAACQPRSAGLRAPDRPKPCAASWAPSNAATTARPTGGAAAAAARRCLGTTRPNVARS